MRIGIVSDIHSNLAAFEVVLANMGPVDALWCLGDLVGYGPDPNECIDLLRRREHLCVLGNHDAAAIGKLDTSDFNPVAAVAAEWTASQLTERSREYLLTLPDTPVKKQPFTITHGSPRAPIWEYITHEARAAANFSLFATPACLVGHTHVPAIFEEQPGGRAAGTSPDHGDSIPLAESKGKLILNPGSVGQPRDRDPRAAYAIYDLEAGTVEWRRVAYPIEVTQQKMREAKLPQPLIDRLSLGL